MARRDHRPILWTFSLSRLNELLERVVPQYAAVADIRVFPQGFEEALETVRSLRRAGEEVDVLISAGASGAFLQRRAPVPVTLITPTGFDVLRALSLARQRGRHVGMATYGAVVPELEQFKELYGLEITQRAYETQADAETAVAELAAAGVDVIVGPSLVMELAERAGLQGVFIYSLDAVRDAIGRAIELTRVARAEEAKRERVDAVLRHLEEGVVAVDREERIVSVNPAMERLLGLPADRALGRPLAELAPALSLSRVLETGEPDLEAVQRLGRRTLVTNRIPIREQGVQTGAVLTCQDSSAIERADRSLRSRHRPSRFVPTWRLRDVLGGSPAIRRARALAERYARTDATVLLTGESGTGKELFAQGIHHASPRRERPFVAINCAALPETLLESELFGHEEGAFTGSRRGGKPGLFEAAHTGTIFLDEVGDMPPALQTRLLRVLQEREVVRLGSSDPIPVDVRVVAATNRDLAARVAEGAFRDDLFYRLHVLTLRLPPLRERREDLPLLAERLLEAALERFAAPGWRTPALRLVGPRLRTCDWPGNVRQLENVIERVAALCAGADPARGLDEAELRAALPELWPARRRRAPARPTALRAVRAEEEREHVRRVLEACGGSQAEAARRLGIGRTTLWRKLREA